MSFFDQRLHIAEEEGQQQGADMAAINISIGHDDDACRSADVGDIKVIANAGAQGRDQRFDLVIAQDLIQTGAFGIEDLAAQGQNGLEMTVAALFG